MADKRSVHTDALDTLGTIIGPDEKRDAIHVAVFPVEAAEVLRPGDHVALHEDGRAGWTHPDTGLGIVDPFLTAHVRQGQRFWLLVYPRQITSLRHVWEHPSFPATQDPGPTLLSPSGERNKAVSEAWLRDWIGNADCPDFETTIAAMLDQCYSEYVHFYGRDASGEIPTEAWRHLEIYADMKFDDVELPSYFSCSC